MIGAAKNLEGDDFMDLLTSVCFLSAVACLILLFIAPVYVIGEQTGEFRGIFSQKNILGQAMSVGALACLHSIRVRKRSLLSGILTFLTITFVAVRSESTTSSLVILLFLVLGVVMPLLQRGKAARTLGVVLLTVLLLVGPIVAIGTNSLFELVGKDATLTGRTESGGMRFLISISDLCWGGGTRILVHGKPGGLGDCEYDLLVRAGGAQWPSGNSFKQRPGWCRLVHLSLGPGISVVFTMHPPGRRNGDNLFLNLRRYPVGRCQ